MYLAPFRPQPRPGAPWDVAPLLRYAAAMIIGVATAWWAKDVASVELWAIVTLAAGILLGLSLRRNGLKRKRGLTLGFALAMIAAVGAGRMQADYERTNVTWSEKPAYREGRIERITKRTEKGVQADIVITASEEAETGRKIRVFLAKEKHSAGEDSLTLKPGMTFSFFSRIESPENAGNPGEFNYRDYLLSHRISGTAYIARAARSDIRNGDHYEGLIPTLSDLRSSLLTNYADYFNAESLAILSAMTLGDKSLLTNDVKTLFSETGTSHVLALSGLHLGILFSLLNFFLLSRFRSKRIVLVTLTLISLVALWGFVLLTGAPLSLQRAAWMFTIIQTAGCFRRTGLSSLNNLSLAALILLTVSPMSLLDVGFQLSFAAVFGISMMSLYVWRRFPLPYWDYETDKLIKHTPIDLYQGIDRWRHRDTRRRLVRPFLRTGYNFFRRTVYPLFTVSLSAQLATLPFVLYYFHVFSPLGLLANFIVVPAAYVIIAGAILFLLLPFTVLKTLVANGLSTVIGITTSLLEGFTRIPGAVWHLYPEISTLILLSIIPFPLYALINERNRKRRKRIILFIGTLLTIAVSTEIYSLRPGRVSPCLTVYNLPKTTAVHFLSSADKSYLFTSSSSETTDSVMSGIERYYFRPIRIAPPVKLRKENEEVPGLVKRGETFIFGNQSVVVLKRNIIPPSEPLKLSLLIVGRGCKMSPEDLFRTFTPNRLVLDSSLTPFYRNRLKNYCEKNRLSFHDVSTDGAFTLPVNL